MVVNVTDLDRIRAAGMAVEMWAQVDEDHVGPGSGPGR